MEPNKDNLESLINFIEDILRLDGNEWMVDKLLEVISEKLPEEEGSSNPKIRRIYEYCIKEVVNKQAEDFYLHFPCSDLRPFLVKDFISMENYRRNNDFDRFGLSIYQQIELITNYLFQTKDFRIKLRTERKAPAYVSWSNEAKDYVRLGDPNVERALLIPPKGVAQEWIDRYFDKDGYPTNQNSKDTNQWPMKKKVRAILYFYYFGSRVKKYELNGPYEAYEAIHDVRNRVHRDVSEDKPIEGKLKEIKGRESQYYLRFYGFLADFISRLEKHWPAENNSAGVPDEVKDKTTGRRVITIGDIPEARNLLGLKDSL